MKSVYPTASHQIQRICYHSHENDGEGNVFTGVCLLMGVPRIQSAVLMYLGEGEPAYHPVSGGIPDTILLYLGQGTTRQDRGNSPPPQKWLRCGLQSRRRTVLFVLSYIKKKTFSAFPPSQKVSSLFYISLLSYQLDYIKIDCLKMATLNYR